MTCVHVGKRVELEIPFFAIPVGIYRRTEGGAASYDPESVGLVDLQLTFGGQIMDVMLFFVIYHAVFIHFIFLFQV